VNRSEGNWRERSDDDKTSLPVKGAMDLWLAKCRVTGGSSLDMLEVEGERKVEMVTMVRC